MILEAIVTTLNEDRSVNISPMGPTVSEDLSQFELRPFPSSKTFANLKRSRVGVMHITDDVELFARAAIGELTSLPELVPANRVDGLAIADVCRWIEFEVTSIDETGQRMSLICNSVHAHRQRDFFGFNRAKHAVLEAAILATRIGLLPAEEIADQFSRLAIIVDKTGGAAEHRAFDLLAAYLKKSL